MALAKHGITKSTPSNIPLGAGTWFKGLKYESGTGWAGTVLGATSGGSSIKITPEIKDVEIDGVLALAKGLAVMQGGTGEAEVNFAEIAKAVRAVDVPVIANGGVFSNADAEKLLSETGADGVMVARASLFNPQIFCELTGKAGESKLEMFRKQLKWTGQVCDEHGIFAIATE